MPKIVYIFTDGACRGNPGPGGWGALMRYDGVEKKLNGAEKHTTNNRMEMMAVIQALSLLTRPCQIEVTTDSQYVKKGISEWMHTWKRNGWRNSQKQPVKNVDLWQLLDEKTQGHTISWHWVKGHSGHPENTIADELANEAINSLLSQS